MADKKEVRITKAMRFADIKALLTDGEVKNGTTVEDACAFIDKELDLLARKNAKKDENGEKVLSDEQKKNLEYLDLIRDYLSTLPEDSKGVTCGELAKAIDQFKDFSTSKMSSLLRMLGEKAGTGEVTSEMVKGSRRFRLA